MCVAILEESKFHDIVPSIFLHSIIAPYIWSRGYIMSHHYTMPSATFTKGSKNTHASTVIPVEKAIPYLGNLHSITILTQIMRERRISLMVKPASFSNNILKISLLLSAFN